MSSDGTRVDAQSYYEDFSPEVGLRDWLHPNARHEALKLRVDALLARRRGLRLLDVGCGAGVLAHHLRRYGRVTATDFSSAAIELGRRLAPGVDFRAGSIGELPSGRFDVLTLFDVVEHIPAADRPGLLVTLADRLAPGGLVVISTPHPARIRHLVASGEPSLQVIEEEVELAALAAEAEDAGLRISAYDTFDLWAGSPEYQWVVLRPAGEADGPPASPPRELRWRLRRVASRPGKVARRAGHALRLLSRGHPRTALWFLRAGASR